MNAEIKEAWSRITKEYGKYIMMPHVNGISVEIVDGKIYCLVMHSKELDKKKIPKKIGGFDVLFSECGPAVQC